jgi:selT/selW/selH-like putative selenoprotein
LVESSIVPHEPASYAAHACCCCGAHAYMCRAAALAEMISAELVDDVTFELEPTPDVTGHFEVEVVGGALLHSRKNGDGFIDSQKKLDKLVAAIEDAVEAVGGRAGGLRAKL